MKIAVLVYGRLHKCTDHYDNIMQSLRRANEVDFFASSDNSAEIGDFVAVYKPLMYNNDPITYNVDYSQYLGRRGETNIHNMTCHFINKNRVFALFEDWCLRHAAAEYDAVVSLRVDCVFQTQFEFDNLRDQTVYIPLGSDYVGGINDQIAYGKPDVMKKYNGINPKELLDFGRSIPHPENLTRANLEFHHLGVDRVDLRYEIRK